MINKDFAGLYIISLSIIIAGLIIGGAIIFSQDTQTGDNLASLGENSPAGQASGNSQSPPPTVSVSPDDDPFKGDENAPVTIIEFSDFECPFCRRFQEQTSAQLIKEYVDTGKARFVYRDFPLTSIHSGALQAAEAAECANEQGKFWEMHDTLFAKQPAFSSVELKQYAQELGFNTDQFNACLDNEKYQQEVQSDFADGLEVGVSGTPTFFINGERLVGAQPFSAFQAIIERQLKELGK